MSIDCMEYAVQQKTLSRLSSTKERLLLSLSNLVQGFLKLNMLLCYLTKFLVMYIVVAELLARVNIITTTRETPMQLRQYLSVKSLYNV